MAYQHLPCVRPSSLPYTHGLRGSSQQPTGKDCYVYHFTEEGAQPGVTQLVRGSTRLKLITPAKSLLPYNIHRFQGLGCGYHLWGPLFCLPW